MPRDSQQKYAWPSSAINHSDMILLHRARELSPRRHPITKLIAAAVRETYGHMADAPTQTDQLKGAA